MLYVILLILLLICAFLFYKWQNEQKANSALQRNDYQQQIYAKEYDSLLKEQRAAEAALAEAQSCKALAAEKMAAAQEQLAQAQRQSGHTALLSGEDFAEWLRRLETAAKLEAEYQQIERDNTPLFARAEKLRAILLECSAAMPLYNGDSGDFYALVGAAEQKQQALKELEADIARAEQKSAELRQGQAKAEAALADNAAWQAEAEQNWQSLLQNYFGGAVSANYLAENLPKLADLIPLKVRADSNLGNTAKLLAELEAQQAQAGDLPQEPAVLEAKLAEMAEQAEQLDARWRQAVEEKTKAETELRQVTGSDEIAQMEQKKQIHLLEMQEKAMEYLRRDFGLKLAQSALEQYRRRHRGPMMEATERAFAELTGGAYPRLKTRYDGKAEYLQAVPANGGSPKEAGDMSKGTRFQLYMALRAAAYQQLLSQNINLPFFCDDIFETFDDERTKAACGLMQHIGRQGQAIYLTHHRHVAEIAQEICGDNVRLHEIRA